jgi:membrane protease YdiL (CAAX protease family)
MPTAPRLDRSTTITELAFFFLLAYGMSWLLWGVIILSHLSAAPGSSIAGRTLYFAGIQGPFLAGLILTVRRGGWTGVRAYYARLVRQPMRLRWILASALAFPCVYLSAAALAVVRDHAVWAHPMVVRPAMGWGMLIFGQLLIVHGEECGWRGFALPRLAACFGNLGGAVILGVLWAFWHLLLFFTAGSWQSGSVWIYLAAMLASCTVQASFFFRANQSVLAAMAFHAFLNASQFTLDVPERTAHYLPWTWIAAVLVALALMPAPLFRLRAKEQVAAGTATNPESSDWLPSTAGR